jgi:CheY-like chemotaxis protein
VGHILIVDDEPDIGQIFRYALEQRGHTVLLADDGARGLATALRRRPDAIVLDLMMPVMDGITALERLKAEGKTHDVPVVVLTATSIEAVRQRCLALGAAAYITKPFDPHAVIEEIEGLLAHPAPA